MSFYKWPLTYFIVNEFNVRAIRLIREDLNGHPLYIQDIVEIDDISIKIATQVKMAKNWLKQLTSEADNEDLDGSDLMFKVMVTVYVGSLV